MMSVGGFSYTKNWDKALGNNPTQLGINAANAAKQFNVGMEIDYERAAIRLDGIAAVCERLPLGHAVRTRREQFCGAADH